MRHARLWRHQWRLHSGHQGCQHHFEHVCTARRLHPGTDNRRSSGDGTLLQLYTRAVQPIVQFHPWYHKREQPTVPEAARWSVRCDSRFARHGCQCTLHSTYRDLRTWTRVDASRYSHRNRSVRHQPFHGTNEHAQHDEHRRLFRPARQWHDRSAVPAAVFQRQRWRGRISQGHGARSADDFVRAHQSRHYAFHTHQGGLRLQHWKMGCTSVAIRL